MRDDSQPPFPLDDAPFFDDDEGTAGGGAAEAPLPEDPSPLNEGDSFALAGLSEPPDDGERDSEIYTPGSATRARALPAHPSAARRASAAAAVSAEHVAPCDLPAERAILACCMLDATAIALAIDHVQPEDFYEERHKLIFAAARRLMDQTRLADPVSLLAELQRAGDGDKVGLNYLIEIPESAGSTLSVEHYARRVSKLASVRRILSASHRVSAEGYKLGVDPDAFVQLVETEMGQALQATVRGTAVHVSEIIGHVYDEVLAARERGGDVIGIPTGFRDLDRMLLGLHATNLIVLAARPAMGKTALALNMAMQVALRQRRESPSERYSVLIFSLEMGRNELVQRLLSTRSRIGLSSLRKGELNPDDEVRLGEAASELSELNLHIDDTPGLTVTDLRARSKRLSVQQKLDFIVVDYLQLMRGTGGARQSREQEISEISRSLKGLAKELGVTVMALSQLNRGVESRTDKRPMMSDLRESGAIEQDADVIAFIYRDHVYNKDAPEHLAELIIAKQRAGPTGKVDLHFEGSLTRFSNLDDRVDDSYVGR